MMRFNELLKNWTTFRIGGPAKYFFIAKNDKDLIKAINFAKKNKIKYFILGSGSNLLFSDKGFSGMVIKLQITNYKLQNNKIIVGSGMPLSKLVIESVNNGLTGLEWAIGIPGSVGGAIYQNAGAWGSDISRLVASVKVYQDGKIKKISQQVCQFSYRQSIFQKNKATILGVELKLKKGNKVKSKELIKKYLQVRQQKQPQGFSAGSVFKNIDFKEISSKTLKTYPQLQNFKTSGIIPAGWLIENTGLKGKKIGGAQISEKHANFIINQGKASAKDVLSLIKFAKKMILKKFKIRIKEEIEIVSEESFRTLR